MTTAETRPADPPTYPRNGSYADLLLWHLKIWQTRPGESTSRRGSKPWTDNDFLKAVFGDVRTDIENQRNLLRNWTGKKKCQVAGIKYHPNISKTIFGGERQFIFWISDLEAARIKFRGHKKNISTLSVDAAIAELVSAGYISVDAENKSAPQASSAHIAIAAEQGFASYLTQAAVEIGIRRDLLESLAARFGHQALDDPDISLLDILKAKAREYHELKTRLSKLYENDDQLSNILGAAQGALDEGNFEEALDFLESAEHSYQNNKTIHAIKAQYEIRVSRGKAEMLAGNMTEAHSHFEKAASFFHVFDTNEEGWSRLNLARVILDQMPWLSNYSKYYEAYKLIKSTTTLFEKGTEDWAFSCYNIGIILCEGDDIDHFKGRGGVLGIKYLNSALRIIKSDLYPDIVIDIFHTMAKSFHNLSGRDFDKGNVRSGMKKIIEARKLEERALQIIDVKIHERQWLESRSSLSAIILEIAKRDSSRMQTLLDEVIELIEDTYKRREIMRDWTILLNYLFRYLEAMDMRLNDLSNSNDSPKKQITSLLKRAHRQFNIEKDEYERQCPTTISSTKSPNKFSVFTKLEDEMTSMLQRYL